MDESRNYYKQNTYTSNASDDSSCTFPLPWLTDTRKRKSRLGKHGRHARVLQEINSQNFNTDIEQTDENHDPLKVSNQASISFNCIKPTDMDFDSHDVGFVRSNDVLDSSFIKMTSGSRGSGDISFSNLDTADLMDISTLKADTNHDMELIDVRQFSSSDDLHQQKNNAYSPLKTNLKTSDHSSFENEILNMHSKSLSSEFVLQANDIHRSTDIVSNKTNYSSPKENVVTDPHLSLFSIDFVSKKVLSSPKDNIVSDNVKSYPVDFVSKRNDYSSPCDSIPIDSTPTLFSADLVAKKSDYSSPQEHSPVNFVLKKNDCLSSKENIDPLLCPAADLVLRTNQSSPKNEFSQRTPFSSETLQKANQVSPKRYEISNPISELFPKPSLPISTKPEENNVPEFKQPEVIAPPPPKKDNFQFEAPLPPPKPKCNEKIPSFITVKGKSYSVLNVLGSGGSSLVYQVLHPDHGEMLAIKQVKLSEVDESIAEGYIDEVKTLKKLQKCGSIIKMYDHEIIWENNKKLLNVVMEKGDTDLAELLKNVNKYKKPTMYMIVYYWTEMLSAVLEIHKEGIIHSDLKPANFLIVKGSLKLIDFGIASSMQGDMTSVYKDVFTGTLNYMSPEAVQFVHYSSGNIGYRITYKTDVWSLGCILYHLIYGRLPFQHLKKKWDKMRAIVDPKIEIEFPEVIGVPKVLMTALKSCLEKDPKKRMSVDQLLQLPYFGN